MAAPPDAAPTVGKRNPPISSHTLHEIVTEYLQCAGMREVVADMRREAEAARATARSAETRTQSTYENGATLLPSSGALEWCLSPSVATRVVVRHLLLDGATKLHAQFHSMGLPAPDAAFLLYALDPNEKHMWSVQDDVDAVYVGRLERGGHAIPAFGTLHQLIEALTHVTVLPLSTRSEEKLLAQEEFTHAFLRQHRYFASSSTVLIKLIERFMVPLSVKLEFDNFEAHGISVHAPGTSFSSILTTSSVGATRNSEAEAVEGRAGSFSPSASLWLCVCRSIQMRVMSVLTLWLREYPQHFDDTMRHSIHLFLDDCASVPQLWGDCPSQLQGMIEFARISISASAAAATQHKRGGTTTARQHRLCDEPPTLPSPSTTCGTVTEENLFVGMQEGPPCTLSQCALSDAGSADEFLTGCSTGSLQDVVTLALTLSVEQYAVGLTSLHLRLFNMIQPEHVLAVAYRSFAAYLSSSAFLLAPVGLFLASSTDLSLWTVSVLLHAAALDGHRMRGARHTSSPAANFVHLYQRLVELLVALVRLNNLHAAVAVHRGLQHPILQRVTTQPRVVALLPESTLQNVAHLHGILGVCGSEEVARGEALESYMRGIADTDVHPLLPPLQHYLGKMTRLNLEMPSFLSLRTDELYPSTKPKEKARDIVVIHWRKYMFLDRMVCQLKAYQVEAQPTPLNTAFENNFMQQKRKIISDHWKLAGMANILLSAL
ncbi:hypothetical protein TraAM80_07985 [Trypanosoma rangeli]|uniref:Ras-GEF domain-containing protein n=1 Tax=Trypanosoma rangeli TaxID=5698 RepID=A0A3R7RCP8_TRYRA|nr:uncharacterized protein TraAM80_07985 [Trypanosoma rangeli]RNE99858.1 hypothetical protein TraAM80_07985 [Trypanosoma rangeli]|eukprot:RNE99858.1 hypothetical protein TraAM80_07985 [Trypanosoma rangeli]